MGLCGQSRCGCEVVSSDPSYAGIQDFSYPSIDVTGSGSPADPYLLALNSTWLTDVLIGVNGPAWVDLYPSFTLTQGGGAIAKTVSYGRLWRSGPRGETYTIAFYFAITGAGTAANAVKLNLPITARMSPPFHMGQAYIYDASANTRYQCTVELVGDYNTAQFAHDGSGAGYWGVAPSIALASGDIMWGTFSYEEE